MASFNTWDTKLIKILDKAIQDVSRCLKTESGHFDAPVKETVQSGLRSFDMARQFIHKKAIHKFQGVEK